MSESKYEIRMFLSDEDGNDGADAAAPPTQKGTIKLRGSLTRKDIERLSLELRFFLNHGCHDWELALDELKTCDPEIMGLLVGAHATIRTRSGKLTLRVSPGSEIDQRLQLSKLSRVLAISSAQA